MKNQFKILCGAVAFVVAGQVSAGTTWTLSTGTVTSSGVTATSAGWANTSSVSGSGVDSYKLQNQTAGTYLRLYGGGLGINNRDGCPTASGTCDVGDISSTAPEHAIDNNQRYEMVLVSFGQSVNLTSVNFGWTGTSDYSGWGSEYTVMAYTGSGAPTLVGKTWATLGSGWVTIGNYANATTGTNNAVNAANTYSSYWLIGAYNPLAAGTTSGLGAGNDALKLASVTGCLTGTGPNCTTTTTTGQVPEPGSMALFSLSLMGLFGLRKHQKS